MSTNLPPARGEGDRSPASDRPTNADSNGRALNWMDGLERFYELSDAALLPCLKEVRIMRQALDAPPSEVMLVIGRAPRDASERLTRAARTAFPGWPVHVMRRLEPPTTE
ncbi:MAG: hypothetical protein HYR85_17910 [Planctomycetes bacterium]|nr:hypothetical protein [Planctomycetota bacterium]MBI3843700.1 hypothetical protein [Planctomycetota bacterium]